MSLIRSEDSRKWINAFVAIVSVITGVIAISFVEQLAEWFDLEARVRYFAGVTQGIGVLCGLTMFIVVKRSQSASIHLQEVYDELVKVVWPDKDTVVKVTVGIIIGLSIMSSLFVGVDYLFRWLLELFY